MNSEKLGLNAFEKVFVAVIPVILAVIFYFLPSLLPLVGKIPFLADNQLIHFITRLEGDWIHWLLSGIGLIAGILIALYIFTEILKMEVHRDYMIIDIFDRKTEIQKRDIESVFKEGKRLVIVNKDGLELLRESTDHSTERLKNAFQKFHYPWVSHDPHAEVFFEWSVDQKELSRRANDILYDRRQALRDEEEKKSKNLRQDLMEIGIVVKDEGSRQYIRITDKESSQEF